jgi:signal transduction histidine kinase
LKEGDDFLPYLLAGLEEQFLKDLETVFAGNSITYEKLVKHNRTNEDVWFEHKFFPLFNSDRKVIGFVYVNKNIEEKKLEFKRVEEKNKVLREVAYIQSHLLRSPLSSMLGLLDLIDKKQLDTENTKYFSYLKPLAQELDMVIRENARKINEFD